MTTLDPRRARLLTAEECLTVFYDCTWGTTEPEPEHTCVCLGGPPCLAKRCEDALEELKMLRAEKK